MTSFTQLTKSDKLTQSKQFPGVYFKAMSVDTTLELETKSLRKIDDKETIPLESLTSMYEALLECVCDSDGNSFPEFETFETFKKSGMRGARVVFKELMEITLGTEEEAKKNQGPPKRR